MGRKHYGKRRKCWLPSPTMFSKGFFQGRLKSWDCVVKSYSFSFPTPNPPSKSLKLKVNTKNALIQSGTDIEQILHSYYLLTHSHTMTHFDAPGKQAF